MSNEKILLLAAAAVGRKGAFCAKAWDGSWGIYSDENGKYPERPWNSFINSADAHDLACELQLNIRHEAWEVIVERHLIPSCRIIQRLTVGEKREQALRDAITLAAAEIGMKRK